MTSDYDGDPHHFILPEPWRWDLVEFSYRRNSTDWQKSFIDLVFVRGDVERRLRFLAPQDVEVSRGILNSSGLCILDVSGRQLDGLRVRVASFEMSYGTPSFWAADVVEVKDQQAARFRRKESGPTGVKSNERIHILEDFVCEAIHAPPFPPAKPKNPDSEPPKTTPPTSQDTPELTPDDDSENGHSRDSNGA